MLTAVQPYRPAKSRVNLLQGALDLFASVTASHRAVLLLLAFYLCGDLIFSDWMHRPGPQWLSATTTELRMVPVGGMAMLIIYVFYMMIWARPVRPIAHLIGVLRGLASAERLANGLIALFILSLFASIFSSFKNMIPVLHPFSWDAGLSDFSRQLHGGVLPYQLLQPVFGSPFVTMMLDRAYVLWFFVTWVVLVWQAFSLHDRVTRARFFMSFFLCWSVLGTVGATLLSSAGPCYYGEVVGGLNPYRPLMEHLHAVDQTYSLFALHAQGYLWDLYTQGASNLGSGISAMPSMHVSMAVLYALLGFRTHRALGIVLSVFAAVIFLGSVELGWHYAPDGYLAALGTMAIWYGTGAVRARLLGQDRGAPLGVAGDQVLAGN